MPADFSSVDHVLDTLAERPHDLIRAYAAGSPFRAATAEELTNADNPFRRPVRPDDLSFLDYSEPMPSSEVLLLGSLLGHRMLRNIYDAELPLVAPRPNPAAARDGGEFSSDRNRILGALARPVLERYLFTFLDQARADEVVSGTAAVRDAVRLTLDRRSEQPSEALEVAATRSDRTAATTFVLLQLAASRPASASAIGRVAASDFGPLPAGPQRLAREEHQRWTAAAPRYQATLADAGLTSTPAAYWQFSLGSSLARGNHLRYLASSGRTLCQFLGALVFYQIDQAATAQQFADLVEGTFGGRAGYFRELTPLFGHELDERLEHLLGQLQGAIGNGATEAFHEGFVDADRLARIWDSDLAEQLAWADRIDDYKDRAEWIQKKLTTDNITVDLDTFVESHEETSTTHVHDDHRLVMIESGEMFFWNNVTHRIALSTGDKVLIPTSRLHGSVVLSGTCTYHQPIIPEELFRESALQ
jgi:hypothetical protein